MQEPPAAFLEIDNFIVQVCGPYEQSWLSGLFALTRYAPYFITLVLYVASFWYKEAYLLLFSLGLTFDGLLNHALNEHFQRGARMDTCLPLWGGSIAYQVQHAAFFTTFVFGYISLYQARGKLWHFILVLLFLGLVCAGAHFEHFHHADAIVNGAALGMSSAVAYQLFLHWFIVPRLCVALATRLARYWAYNDSLCTHDPVPLHVQMVEGFDAAFPGTGSMVSREGVREFIARQTY